jgi:hypothetical protein
MNALMGGEMIVSFSWVFRKLLHTLSEMRKYMALLYSMMYGQIYTETMNLGQGEEENWYQRWLMRRARSRYDDRDIPRLLKEPSASYVHFVSGILGALLTTCNCKPHKEGQLHESKELNLENYSFKRTSYILA